MASPEDFGAVAIGPDPAKFGAVPVSPATEPSTVKANKSLAQSVGDFLKPAGQTVLDMGTVYGPIEAALSVMTGLAFGFPVYLGAGVGTLLRRGMGWTDDDPKEIASRYAEAVTYHARSTAGQRLTEATLLPLTALNNLAEGAGHKVVDVTQSPAAGALTEATIQMLPAPILSSFARRLAGEIPTRQQVDDVATSVSGEHSPDIASKINQVYEETGIDPQAVHDAAAVDPTVIQELASSNRPVPEALGGKTAQESTGTTQGAGAPPVPSPPTGTPSAGPAGPGAPKPPLTAQEAVLERIVPGELPSRIPTLDQLYTKVIDNLNPIKLAEKESTGGTRLPTGESPYDLERLTRGMFGKGQQFIKNGTYDFETYKTTGNGYEEILKPVQEDLDGFRAYMVARRAIEQEGKGLQTGVPLPEAQAVVAAGKAKYEAVFQERLAYKDQLLDQLVKSGILGEKNAATIRAANEAHVPFYRLFEDEVTASGASKVRNPVMRFTGSDRKIIDPIESDIKDTFLFISLAEKNAARQAFVALGKPYAEKVKASVRPIEVTDKELAKELAAQGIKGNPQAFDIFRANKITPQADEIAVFKDGKREVYKVDPEVASAFNQTDRASASFLSNILATPAQLLRAGVTVTPDFAMRNFIRDAVSSFIYTGSHPINTVKGAVSLFGKDEAFQNWLKGGGANATMLSMDRNYIQQHLFELNAEVGAMQKTWNIVKTPYELLRITSEVMENVTRLGSVRDPLLAAKDKATIQALSMISREATVDFARHGGDPFLQSYSRMTAFMNPGIQGIDRMARAMKENPLGTTAKAFASITIPSMLLWWANHDDPRYKEIPDWQKDLFWMVMTKDHIYRIPKDFQWGVIFGSLPERLMDKFFDENPRAFKNFGKSMLDGFQVNAIPTFAVPPMEQLTNHSFFTDRPLIPSHLEKILPEYQYTPYTSEATKAIAHIIGSGPGLHASSIASPLVIDNYVRGWTGTLGTYAVQIADLALRKTGALPDPIKPAMTLADYPVIKAFVVRHPSASAQSIADFHESYRDAAKTVATVRYLAQNGDAEAMQREIKFDPAKMVKLDGIQQALSKSQEVIQLIDKNQKINSDEKRQLIDTIYLQMIQMANGGNTMVREVKDALGKDSTKH